MILIRIKNNFKYYNFSSICFSDILVLTYHGSWISIRISIQAKMMFSYTTKENEFQNGKYIGIIQNVFSEPGNFLIPRRKNLPFPSLTQMDIRNLYYQSTI